MPIGQAIANRRYVVRGVCDDDGRRWAIHATNDQAEAERVMLEGVERNGRHWSGTAVHDRRQAILPPGGWGAAPEGAMA